jgi:hypothetical protein
MHRKYFVGFFVTSSVAGDLPLELLFPCSLPCLPTLVFVVFSDYVPLPNRDRGGSLVAAVRVLHNRARRLTPSARTLHASSGGGVVQALSTCPTPSDDDMNDDMDDKDREGWDRVHQGATAAAFQPRRDVGGVRNHVTEAFIQKHPDMITHPKLETLEAKPRGTAPAEEDAEGWGLARQEAAAALPQQVEAGFVTTRALSPPGFVTTRALYTTIRRERHPTRSHRRKWECRPTGPSPEFGHSHIGRLALLVDGTIPSLLNTASPYGSSLLLDSCRDLAVRHTTFSKLSAIS